MQDMVVRAPFDGTIATKNTEVGEVISSVMMGQVGGTLPAGAICTLVDLNTLEVVADVNESSIGQLREGQAAEVSVDAFPNQKWKGVLRQIIPTADRAKATVQVKVKIVDPGDRLLPEMSSSVSFLQSERTDAEMHEPAKIWLPASAVSGRSRGRRRRGQARHACAASPPAPCARNGLRSQAASMPATASSPRGVDALENGQLVRFE